MAYHHWSRSEADAVQRLINSDSTLKCIDLGGKRYSDAELTNLVDCLIVHPDAVTSVCLDGNQLTDEIGVKLARYLALSSTVRGLFLQNNQFGDSTYLAFAEALRVNASLQYLSLQDNIPLDKNRIDAAFVDALILNPNRPGDSSWILYSYSWGQNNFQRLKMVAEELGHPSMLAMLSNQLVRAF